MLKGEKKTVGLKLPEECYRRIKELADDTHRTVPSYIRMVLFNYLRQLERAQGEEWWTVR